MKTVLISTALIMIGRASTKNDSKENDSKVALMPPFISSEQEIFAMASNRFHDTITKRDDALRSKKSASPAGVIEHVCSASGLIAVAWD
jgi:hypothetical protein